MRQKRVTSLDVARQAGVSRTTVSLVLNKVYDNRIRPETAERVFNAARELGYVPDAAARALASRRTGAIGFLLSRDSTMLSNGTQLAGTLTGIIDVVRSHGQRLLFDLVDDVHNPRTYVDLVHSGQIDGLILSGARINEDTLLERLEESFPVVLLGSPATRLASVTMKYAAAAQAAVAHLIEQGAGRVAFICHDPQKYADAAEMLLGYRLALEAAGQDYDPSLVRCGALDPETGGALMSALLELDDVPDAVFASADPIAFGALSVLQTQQVRVPAEIALAGFGDLHLTAYTVPQLTSVRIPVYEMARRAASLLVELVSGRQPAQRQVALEAQLQVRASTDAK